MDLRENPHPAIDILVPEAIYAAHLATINGIAFTHREIDIIACILGGRAAKKIASFLDISPKTVENHIRNAMIKIGCRSQEHIIDFIEKSGKFIFIKKYYASVLIQTAFEMMLKQVSTLLKVNSSLCSLISDKNKNDIFIESLDRHLSLIGFKVKMSLKSKSKIKTDNVHCVIEVFTSTSVTTGGPMPADSIPSIYLWGDPYSPLGDSETEQKRRSLDLREKANYHFLFCELLGKIFSQVNLDKEITAFKRQYNTLVDPTVEQQKGGAVARNLSKERDPWLWVAGSLCLVIFYFSYLKLNENSIINNHNQIFTVKAQSHPSVPMGSSYLLAELESGKPVHWDLPRQDHIFVGREKLLDELASSIQFGKASVQGFEFEAKARKITQNSLAISACAGLGGIGKTQLALQYAQHNQYAYTLTAWFPSDNIEQLQQKYLEFAKALGYIENNLTVEIAILYVKNWLSEHPGWLLIFDNVNTYEEIAPFLPESGGHVILTTRNRDWPDKFKVLSIDVMLEEEAIQLIEALIGRRLIGEEIDKNKEVVRLLGYLPLALAQAGSYIRQNQITVTEYLELCKNHLPELLADNTVPVGTSHTPVALTWNISLLELAKTAKLKKEPFFTLFILRSCAYLSPEKISQSLLLSLLKQAYPHLTSPELVLSTAIGELWRLSLVNSNDTGEMGIHRLMQVILRHQHKHPPETQADYPPLTSEWYDLMLKGMDAEFNRKTQGLEDDQRQRSLLPHLLSLIEHCKASGNKQSPELGRALYAIGWGNYLLGDIKSAYDYGESALKIFKEHYGENHFEVAKALNILGYYNIEMGDPKAAKTLLMRSFKMREKLYGKNHKENAITLSNLGGVYQELGHPKQAKQLLEDALKMLEAHYSNNDWWKARTLTRLADVYWVLNDIQKRKLTLEHALKILENYYGGDHPEVAKTLISLSEAYRDEGDYTLEKTLIERALKIQEQRFGSNHPETSKALNNLGNVYAALGDAARAKILLENALKIKEHYYGEKHLEVAKTLSGLGEVYRELGDVVQAKKLHERVLEIRLEYYGNKHPEVAKILTALGKVYLLVGEVKQSEALLVQALKIKEQFYGNNHPEIAKTLFNMVEIYISIGKNKEANALGQRCYTIFVDTYGKDHHDTKKILNLIKETPSIT